MACRQPLLLSDWTMRPRQLLSSGNTSLLLEIRKRHAVQAASMYLQAHTGMQVCMRIYNNIAILQQWQLQRRSQAGDEHSRETMRPGFRRRVPGEGEGAGRKAVQETGGREKMNWVERVHGEKG